MKRCSCYLKKTQWLWAFFILPTINITALFLADPLYENITHIAYAKHQLTFVFLWVFTCAYYLFIYTLMFINRIKYKKSIGIFFLMLACIGMIFSICIPYDHKTIDTISKLHVDLAMASTVLYILVFFHILVHCYFYDPKLWKTLFPMTVTLVGSLSLLFLLMGSVSTLIESVFVIGMGLLLYCACKKAA